MHDDDHTTVGKLERDKRSPQKKAMLPKINGTPLLKWLAAFCVLDCVGAATEPWSAEFVAMEKRHAAQLEAIEKRVRDVEEQLQVVRQCSGCMPPLSGLTLRYFDADT